MGRTMSVVGENVGKTEKQSSEKSHASRKCRLGYCPCLNSAAVGWCFSIAGLPIRARGGRG
jgi:hypothetical protein